MTTELARRHSPDDLPNVAVAGQITEALSGLKAVRTFIDAEFTPGMDFGTIPGCGDKRCLFLPGAQKATMYFNAFPTYRVKANELPGDHVEYRVRAILISRVTGAQIGEGIGCASTREKKFRRSAGVDAKKCPKCGKPAIFKSKDKPEWYCWRKKDGCGAIFPLNDPAMKALASEPEADAPFEVRNTVLKMAKKRAHVDAAMTLGCLSEMFTQDIEDTYPMVEVREATRDETVPHHVNGEVVPEAHQLQPSAPGLFSNEHKEKTVRFGGWISNQCQKINAAWQAEWDEMLSRAMADGLGVPAAIPDVINPWQAKNHLLKWAVESERLDPTLVPEDQKLRQTDAYLALVYYRSDEDKKALIAEMGGYLARQRVIKSDVVYRNYPELAPDGYAEEKAEAHGEAYEGDYAGNPDPAEAGKDS